MPKVTRPSHTHYCNTFDFDYFQQRDPINYLSKMMVATRSHDVKNGHETFPTPTFEYFSCAFVQGRKLCDLPTPLPPLANRSDFFLPA